jgi:polygalacturonase
MLTAAEVWRKYQIDGVPASGPNKPDKAQVQAWGAFLESLLGAGAAGLAYANLAALSADLAHAASTTAIVYADAAAANNGLYVKAGASGSGSWSRIGDLPNAIVRLTVTGGTGNAIVATAPEVPLAPGAKLYLMTPAADHASGAVTIAVNGNAPVALKDAFGNNPAAGALQDGSPVLMAWPVDHYQLLISANVDASGILAAALAAQAAAEDAATAASSSASALGNQVHQYDTRALAIAATIPAGVQLVRLLGRSAAGDLGGAGALHSKLGSTPSPVRSWHFQSSDGAYWRLKEYAVNPRMFGAVGDGVTDDRAAVQDAIDFASTMLTNGRVEGVPGDDYKCVIDSGVTDLGLALKAGVRFDLRGASISFACSGNVYAMRLQSNATIENGTVRTTVSTGLSTGQSIAHTPISLGAFYGAYATVGAIDAYASPVGWKIRNLTITNVRADSPTPGGSMIAIYGGANHGVIEDITIPDNATVGIGIGMDWMPVGPLDVSTLAAINATKASFNSGATYTLHPHDIDVRRINIGNMSVPKTVGNDFGSHGIRLSGCYAIRIDGVSVAGSTYAGFFHTAGDCGFEFAQAATKNRRYKGTRVSNYRIENANNGWGVFSDCYADNIALRVADGYSNLLPAQGETDIVYDNVQTQGSLTSSAWPGFRVQNQQGGELRNCRARYHSVGVLIETNCDRLHIIGGAYDSNWLHGIHCLSGDAAEDLLIQGVQAFSNGQGAGSADAGIYLQVGARPVVRDCILGGVGGDSFQDFGVRCVASQDTIIEDNYIVSHVAGGAGISIGATNDVGVGAILAKASGNRFGASVTTKYGGAAIIPHDYRIDLAGNKIIECQAATAALSSHAPISGTWTRGCRIFYSDPSAGGIPGTECVAAGSPGTWKAMAALAT